MIYLIDYKKIADEHIHKYCQELTFKTKKEWLELRTKGVGGSDVAGIMNKSPFTDKLGVWKSKQDDYESKELKGYPIEFGSYFEDIIFRTFAFKYRDEYAALNYKNSLFRNYFYEHEQASVDGILVHKKTKKVGVLEIKTIQASVIKHWYNREGKLVVPYYYKLQCLHYMNLLELDFYVVYALANTSNESTDMRFLKPIIVWRDEVEEELEEVREVVLDFWTENVIGNKKPGIRI